MSFKSFSKFADVIPTSEQIMNASVHQLEQDITDMIAEAKAHPRMPTLAEENTCNQSMQEAADELIRAAEHLERRSAVLRAMAEEIIKW